MTPQAKRRARDAKYRQAALEQKQREEVAAAYSRGEQEGRAAGKQYGAKVIRDTVLDHAGRLYKEGEDDAARAVRDVQRLLPTTV